MFDALKGFLLQLARQREPETVYAGDDFRLAVAAILAHVADADGTFGEGERSRAQSVLAERFDLSPGDAARLIREGMDRDREEVDIDRFVNILKRNLDKNARLRIVAMMWDVVYADGVANDIEDAMIWRIAGLLGVSGDECETLRRSRSVD